MFTKHERSDPPTGLTVPGTADVASARLRRRLRPAAVGGPGRRVATFIAPILFVVAHAHAASPPNLERDVPWDENPATVGNQQSYSGVAAIRAAFDNGRRQEERQLGLSAGTLGNLSLPSQTTWDATSPSQRALLIINAERVARGGVSYAGGTALGLPLAGVESNIDTLARQYADYQVANGFWAHAAPAGGPAPFAGTSPFSRIDNAPVIGNALGTNGGNCHQFLPRAENLAWFASTQAIPLPLERSLYTFIYDDASSAWGHREALLLQDRALNGASGFTNDVGSAASEGYMGLGMAGASDGSFDPFGNGFPYQLTIVFKMFDPTPDTACAYEVLGEEEPSGPPPAATGLSSPAGATSDTTPTYRWQAVPGSTWYMLWVNDATGNLHRQWYTAAEAGCAGGGSCAVTPAAVIAYGNATWWIRTWNPNGAGPWSAARRFSVGTDTAPGPVTELISPSGTTTGQPSYSWQGVPGSTWYWLWVNDATGNVHRQWYTAAAAGCAAGGTCTIAPGTTLASGDGVWWVRSWNDVGFGPWSAGRRFSVP